MRSATRTRQAVPPELQVQLFQASSAPSLVTFAAGFDVFARFASVKFSDGST